MPHLGGVERDWLDFERWKKNPSALDTPLDTVEARFGEGGHCLLIRARETGEVIYHIWVSASGAWIDWIGARIRPPPDTCLIFDAWAHERWRGHDIHLLGAALACNRARELGKPRIAAGVEAHEVAPFARMYARAGIGAIEPYEVIVQYRLGRWSCHYRASPPGKLVQACRSIGKRYSEKLAA